MEPLPEEEEYFEYQQSEYRQEMEVPRPIEPGSPFTPLITLLVLVGIVILILYLFI